MAKGDSLENMSRENVGLYLAKGTKEYQTKMRDVYVDNLDMSGLKKPLGFIDWADGVVGKDRKYLDDENQKLRERNGFLENETKTDLLTQIGNRKQLAEHYESAMARFKRNGEPFSVMMIDIDHFKNYNDTHGHAAGDATLYQFAQSLKKNIRNGIDSICRYGGEEFAAIFPGVAEYDAVAIGEHMRKAVENMNIDLGNGLQSKITFSSGINSFIKKGDSFDKSFKRADSALYRAKNDGRNRIVCYESE